MSTATPLISYSFQRRRCLKNEFTYIGSDALSILKSSEAQAGCLYGDGISSVAKVSSSDMVSSLKSLLGAKDYAIEMWLRPKLNVTTTEKISSQHQAVKTI